MHAHNAGMPVPATTFWQRCVRSAQALLFPRYWIAVMADEGLRGVINSEGREVTADGRTRRVSAGDRQLATFDAVQSIDVVHHPRDADNGKPEHWSVSLYLGRSMRAYVGRSRKHAEAVKAAALLARISGKTVRSLEAANHPSVIHSR
jgi:hypothetical protein